MSTKPNVRLWQGRCTLGKCKMQQLEGLQAAAALFVEEKDGYLLVNVPNDQGSFAVEVD